MSAAGSFSYPNYTSEEHETWSLLYSKQKELLPGRACSEFLDGLSKLKLSENRIPALGDVDQILYSLTKWNLVRVEGLVPENEFFEFLAKRQFPSTDFIRKRDELSYTPSPDMFHDLFGHVSMITHPDFADFFQIIGLAARNANEVQMKELQRFYWFTVEFGLIYNAGKRRIYGSGILSSPGEVVYCLSENVKVHEFSTSKVRNQEFDIWHMQGELFIIKSFDQLKTEFTKYVKSENLPFS